MIMLKHLINKDSLTIFTDASIKAKPDGTNYGCPGFVAVDGNGIIDSGYIVYDNTTNNDSEIKAIRMGVMAANKYKNNYKYIRLFSDSQLCIFGLRQRIYSWLNNINNGYICGYDGNPIKNQEIFIEIAYYITQNNLNIEFYHQRGHISLTNPTQLEKARNDFLKFNEFSPGTEIDMELVKTISYYNNMVDQTSRNTLNSVLSQIPSSYSMVYDDSYKFKYIDTFDIKGFYKNTHNIK